MVGSGLPFLGFPDFSRVYTDPIVLCRTFIKPVVIAHLIHLPIVEIQGVHLPGRDILICHQGDAVVGYVLLLVAYMPAWQRGRSFLFRLPLYVSIQSRLSHHHYFRCRFTQSFRLHSLMACLPLVTLGFTLGPPSQSEPIFPWQILRYQGAIRG